MQEDQPTPVTNLDGSTVGSAVGPYQKSRLTPPSIGFHEPIGGVSTTVVTQGLEFGNLGFIDPAPHPFTLGEGRRIQGARARRINGALFRRPR